VSDERFDHDLRSVLHEDAPRDVPDDLRRRVAAVPATNPVASRLPRPAWRHPIGLWSGLAAVVLAMVAIGIWRIGPVITPGVGGTPSPSPSIEPSPSPSAVAAVSPLPASSPSPAPSASGAAIACRNEDLAGQILGWQGAAGSRIAAVRITNTSAHMCIIRGTPALQLIDASGIVLVDSATAGPSGQPHVMPSDPAFKVAPGGKLRTDVAVSNYCGPDPTLPIDIVFRLWPDGRRLLVTPGPGTPSDEAVPPCTGSTGSEIAMNGWRE
jgi:hypothetical protein